MTFPTLCCITFHSDGRYFQRRVLHSECDACHTIRSKPFYGYGNYCFDHCRCPWSSIYCMLDRLCYR